MVLGEGVERGEDGEGGQEVGRKREDGNGMVTRSREALVGKC